jgi:hypothetical protein
LIFNNVPWGENLPVLDTAGKTEIDILLFCHSFVYFASTRCVKY